MHDIYVDTGVKFTSRRLFSQNYSSRRTKYLESHRRVVPCSCLVVLFLRCGFALAPQHCCKHGTAHQHAATLRVRYPVRIGEMGTLSAQQGVRDYIIRTDQPLTAVSRRSAAKLSSSSSILSGMLLLCCCCCCCAAVKVERQSLVAP